MTLKQALKRAREALVAQDIEDASLESEVLLRHVLHINRVQLYQDLDRELLNEQFEAYLGLVERRLKGEPSAYITGHREFYGIDFCVDPRVLIPRPESELLVERALMLAQRKTITSIADVGTGCGALAVSLALQLPSVRVYATDISPEALEVAGANCRKHGVLERIELIHCEMVDAVPEPVDLIVANLPYVRTEDITSMSGFEPHLALDAGADGLDRIRRLCLEVNSKLRPGGALLVEIGKGQGKAVADLLRGVFPAARIEITPDLAGIERVVSLENPPA